MCQESCKKHVKLLCRTLINTQMSFVETVMLFNKANLWGFLVSVLELTTTLIQ